MRKENSMKYFKYLIINILICFSLVNWACDDRTPEEDEIVNGVLEIIELQPICCFENNSSSFGIEVGEIISGSSIMKVVVTLKNEGGTLQKGKTVTFSDNIDDNTNDADYFINGITMTTDDNGEVLQYYKPNSGIEKIGNDLARITIKYGTSISTNDEFEIFNDKTDVWPYTLIVNADPDNIKLDNGITTSNIQARLYNNEDPPKPVKNVRIDFIIETVLAINF